MNLPMLMESAPKDARRNATQKIVVDNASAAAETMNLPMLMESAPKDAQKRAVLSNVVVNVAAVKRNNLMILRLHNRATKFTCQNIFSIFAALFLIHLIYLRFHYHESNSLEMLFYVQQ